MKKLILLLGICAAIVAKAQVNFTTYTNLETMLKAAKSQQKSIFIDGYTDWCGWCKVLDKEVFSDKIVADTLHKYFIPVKLEMEKDSLGVIIARKYGVRSFPIALIINPDGRLVTKIGGYAPLDRYNQLLQNAIKKTKENVVVAGHSDNYNLKYPNFYLKAFPMPGKKREKKDSIEVNTYLSHQKNWNNELVWLVLKTNYYLLSKPNQEKLTQQLPELARLFSESEVEELYMSALDKQLTNALNYSDEEQFFTLLNSLTKPLKSAHWYQYYYKTAYYKNHKIYDKLVVEVDTYIERNAPYRNAEQLNEFAWELYQYCEDRLLLTRAINWMKNWVLLNNPSYNHFDTYAALLFKTGNLAEAKAQAKLAIKVGKADGEKTTETEKLLMQIEDALANKTK